MLVSIGDEKKGGEPNENELEGENKHYVPVLYRGGKWYFCPGEKNGRLLKCSPDNLVRMLTVRDQKEVLLEALKEPFIPEQGDIGMDIEAIVSTTCGGFGYVNWLAICPTRAELQKFYFMPVRKSNNQWAGGKNFMFNIRVEHVERFEDMDSYMG